MKTWGSGGINRFGVCVTAFRLPSCRFIDLTYDEGMNDTMSGIELRAAIGENIRVRRKELRLTQQELADAAGVAQANISQFEKGHSAPSIDTLAKIAEALQVSPDILLRPGIFSAITA